MGVLLVNMTMIDGTLFSGAEYIDGGLSALVQKGIHLFAVGKFYSLFSMLFGLGFYYFMNKDDGTLVKKPLFKRRLAALFVFGLLHLIFVWNGDILHVYALTGLFLLFNTETSPQKLVKMALLLFVVSTAMFVLLQSGSDSDINVYDKVIKEATNVYSKGSYLEVVTYRVTKELPLIAINFLFVLPKILSLFFLGYAIGKKQIFNALDAHKKLIHRTWLLTGLLSLTTGAATTLDFVMSMDFNMVILLDEVLTVTGALFYATSLIKLYDTKIGKRLLTPLKYAGQMALTNYLTQTIVMSVFFYGYGFGQFEKLPYWSYIPMMLTLYGIQLIISSYWMKRHRFGPMEKVWRTLTYGKSHLKA